ncbi:U-box domain-containing protein 34 isoform X2 [Typha angustifolia]|uniref:U-box domain-containing protein 34 isoform X2 n=1 Tax=Typha angustifolia TaxID=59011 RepID=UPI003C2AE954
MSSVSVFGGGCDSLESTVAVAVSRGHRSRRAVRWAEEHLLPHADRFLLIHVIPVISTIPSPSGRSIPIEKIEKGVVDMYVQDMKSKAQEVFLPFKRLCGRRNVETLVLEGENPAAALLSYVPESGTKNLVLGASSMSWIRRLLKVPDVATAVLKFMPSSCNIFVVSRWKVTMKFPNQAVIIVSHKAIAQRQRDSISREKYVHSFQDSRTSQISGQVDSSSCFQAIRDSHASIDSGRSSEIAQTISFNGVCREGSLDSKIREEKKQPNYDDVSHIPYVIVHSMKESEAPDEVAKVRRELQNTLAMYNRACENLVHAKKKIQYLTSEYTEETKKVNDALEREDMLRLIVAEEKAKHLEAVKEVEEARKLLATEVLDRHKADLVADTMSSEKSKVVDVLLSSGNRCRRYSRNEIEIATDNFSDAKKIGEGSYGNVYKSNLDHTAVAIKVLRQDSSNKMEEFLREVEILGQLSHPHMVLLLGFCPENGCLVYEHMENGSLEDQLFSRNGAPPLPWFIRFQIIFEVACGLAFLHGTKPEPIVHRDLKPGNILLDRNYVSKIGDVGLAKLISNVVPDGLTEYKETILAGTLYYMDPEYQRTGTVRPKSDLYALGIISLQLLTGKHPNGLIVNVENAIKRGSFVDILDKDIIDWPLVEAERLAKLALRCCRLRCRDRPSLESEVLPELEELVANVSFKLRKSNVCAPSHYICPILQAIMENPYVAADGYTYEYRAIKAWLAKYDISPITKLRLTHTSIIPNHSLQSAIQKWKQHAAFLNS